MSAYAEEVRRCQLVLVLRAIVESGGNQVKAAAACGLHRNTVQRLVRGAGYDMSSLKALARQRSLSPRKPPASVTSIDAARRMA